MRALKLIAAHIILLPHFLLILVCIPFVILFSIAERVCHGIAGALPWALDTVHDFWSKEK